MGAGVFSTKISTVDEKILFVFVCSYDVVVSSDVARTRTNGCIFFKLRDPAVDVLPTHYYSHKFVCVAPYNTDTLLLINIPKTMLEKVIKVRKLEIYSFIYDGTTLTVFPQQKKRKSGSEILLNNKR